MRWNMTDVHKNRSGGLFHPWQGQAAPLFPPFHLGQQPKDHPCSSCLWQRAGGKGRRLLWAHSFCFFLFLSGKRIFNKNIIKKRIIKKRKKETETGMWGMRGGKRNQNHWEIESCGEFCFCTYREPVLYHSWAIIRLYWKQAAFEWCSMGFVVKLLILEFPLPLKTDTAVSTGFRR